nr:hypothetical protein [Tanacetum cinerariifolium]
VLGSTVLIDTPAVVTDALAALTLVVAVLTAPPSLTESPSTFSIASSTLSSISSLMLSMPPFSSISLVFKFLSCLDTFSLSKLCLLEVPILKRFIPGVLALCSDTILPTTDPKDKGKGIMQEPEKPPKNPIMAQIQLDEELAKRMHEEEKDKLEKRQCEIAAAEEASRAAINQELDDIQAMIEADEQMASRL